MQDFQRHMKDSVAQLTSNLFIIYDVLLLGLDVLLLSCFFTCDPAGALI